MQGARRHPALVQDPAERPRTPWRVSADLTTSQQLNVLRGVMSP